MKTEMFHHVISQSSSLNHRNVLSSHLCTFPKTVVLAICVLFLTCSEFIKIGLLITMVGSFQQEIIIAS